MPFGLRPAIGLMIDQKQIAMCVTAATAKGRRKIAQEIHDCDERSQEEIVGRMLERFVAAPGVKRRKPRPWVRLGLPEARVFQAALPITSANHQNTAQNFFLEAVQATNVRAEDRIVELIKVELAAAVSLRVWPLLPAAAVESSIGMISQARRARGTDRAGARGALSRGRVSPESAARLEALRSVLPGRAPRNRRHGRRAVSAFLA